MEVNWTYMCVECQWHPYPGMPLDVQLMDIRKIDRPKENWRGTVGREMKEQRWTWGFLKGVAADGLRWVLWWQPYAQTCVKTNKQKK